MPLKPQNELMALEATLLAAQNEVNSVLKAAQEHLSLVNQQLGALETYQKIVQDLDNLQTTQLSLQEQIRVKTQTLTTTEQDINSVRAQIQQATILTQETASFLETVPEATRVEETPTQETASFLDIVSETTRVEETLTFTQEIPPQPETILEATRVEETPTQETATASASSDLVTNSNKPATALIQFTDADMAVLNERANDSSPGGDLIDAALNFLSKGKLRQAHAQFLQLVQLEADNPMSWLALAATTEDQDKAKEWMAQYEALLNPASNDYLSMPELVVSGKTSKNGDRKLPNA